MGEKGRMATIVVDARGTREHRGNASALLVDQALGPDLGFAIGEFRFDRRILVDSLAGLAQSLIVAHWLTVTPPVTFSGT